MMKRFLATMILPLMLAASATAQELMVVRGKQYPKADTVLYYMPQGEIPADGAKQPAVILLHGYGGTSRQWERISPLQTLANEYGMILICPDAFKDTWYIDAPDGSNDYATFFADELMPALMDRLPIDSTQLFITGLSMGGHGALQMMMRCKGKFRAVGSMSGVVDLRASALSKTSLAKLLGPKGAGNQNWAKFSATDNVQAIKDCGTPIIISCGAQDYLIEANRAFAKKCGALGLDIVYTESPGRHENPYWRITLPEHLRFFRKFTNE